MALDLTTQGSLRTIVDILDMFSENYSTFAKGVIDFVTADASTLIANFNQNSTLPTEVKEIVAQIVQIVMGDMTMLSVVFGLGIGTYLLITLVKWIVDLIP